MYMGGKFIQTHPCNDAGEFSVENADIDKRGVKCHRIGEIVTKNNKVF